MTAGKRGPELISQRSFDAGGSRPHKFFKLDRTYSDVVEDELYAAAEVPPTTAEASAKDASSSSADSRNATGPQTKTARIQKAYPQLFEHDGRKSDASEASSESPAVDFRGSNYFTGMESSVRFEGKQVRGLQNDKLPVVADRMKKLNAQPKNVPTVSPVEAFLEMPSMPAPTAAYINGSASSSDALLPSPSTERSNSLRSEAGFVFPRQSTQELKLAAQVGHAEPSSIIPVRQNGHEAPRPVQNQFLGYSPYGGPMDVRSFQPAKQPDAFDASFSGPSAVQALQNKDANARFRALSKEESSVSNLSSMSSGYGDSESEPSASQQYSQALQQHHHKPVSTQFACEECGRVFDRQLSLTAHKRIHNKASTSRSPVGVAGDVDDSDDFVPPPEDEDRARGTSHTNKNGPHRCDWIIPATGERCGTSFSRPYDLIRHQDTIHGNKRKEFRCEICRAASVEKVFSRNDALVRHMRHVHNQELKK